MCDVIAYVGRDIEDAISLGLIKREDLPRKAVEVLGGTNREIINNLAMDLVHNTNSCGELHFSDEAFQSMKALLRFNYEKIYEAPMIQEQKRKFARIVRELFELYLSDIKKGNEKSVIFADHLSLMDSTYHEENSVFRIVADFIAGMTDRYLLSQYIECFMPERIGYHSIS